MRAGWLRQGGDGYKQELFGHRKIWVRGIEAWFSVWARAEERRERRKEERKKERHMHGWPSKSQYW